MYRGVVMTITHMTNGMILKVYQRKENEHIANVLYGEVTDDETCRFEPGFRVITSPIIVSNEYKTVFYTKYQSCYKLKEAAGTLEITPQEWILMRDQLFSPAELLAIRLIAKGEQTSTPPDPE